MSEKNVRHEFVEICTIHLSRGLSNVVRDTNNYLTMTPQPTCKCLGVGASCTVKLRFLHPKNQVKDKIPNQSSSQQLTRLIVQSKAEKIICKVNKDCIVFRLEDFGRQLVWALQRYVHVDIEGPEQSFLMKKPRSRLLLLVRAPINTTSPHKRQILQMPMRRAPSRTTLKSFIRSFRKCWTGVGTTWIMMTSLV